MRMQHRCIVHAASSRVAAAAPAGSAAAAASTSASSSAQASRASALAACSSLKASPEARRASRSSICRSFLRSARSRRASASLRRADVSETCVQVCLLRVCGRTRLLLRAVQAEAAAVVRRRRRGGRGRAVRAAPAAAQRRVLRRRRRAARRTPARQRLRPRSRLHPKQTAAAPPLLPQRVTKPAARAPRDAQAPSARHPARGVKKGRPALASEMRSRVRLRRRVCDKALQQPPTRAHAPARRAGGTSQPPPAARNRRARESPAQRTWANDKPANTRRVLGCEVCGMKARSRSRRRARALRSVPSGLRDAGMTCAKQRRRVVRQRPAAHANMRRFAAAATRTLSPSAVVS
jgi:hypothetical protein